jgi:hypothetical protein
MLPADERAFFAMLRERGDTQLVDGSFHRTRRPPVLERLAGAGPEIVLSYAPSGAGTVLHTKGAGEYAGRYTFELFVDPFITWSRCRKKRGALLAGRIHGRLGRGTDGAAHERWFASIARWIRTFGERAPASAGRWTIAPEAARFWRAGNLFCFGDENALRAGPDLRHVPVTSP